nr:hypothetical protein [Tanacetum cinerariifolium]
ALYTKSCDSSKGGSIDKFVRDPNKTPDSSQRSPQDCPKCGNPVDGQYCRHCALLRKKLKKVWFTIRVEHKFFQDFLNTFKSSNDDSNVVNAPQEPIVFNQDPGENSSQSPPQIDHQCCYGCSDLLDGIFCQQCTYNSCGKGAHYGYNCSLKVWIISNQEPCHNQNVKEIPQTLPSFHPTCYSGDENSFAYDSTPNFVNDSPNVFNPHSQPLMYSYEFCGNNAQYGHDCPPQDSLSMGDEHLDTIPEKKLDKFIKSSVENLVPNPSKSEDEHEYDVPVCDDVTTFSNLLFGADDNFSSSDNKSLLNQDSLIISFSKIDSLLDEFVSELILLKSIPPGIDKVDCDPEEEIHLIEKLWYDNSSPRPPKEINSKNSDAIIEYFSPSSIPIEDSDSLMEEIDLSLTPDESMPPALRMITMTLKGIYLSLKNFLAMIPFHFLKMSHFILIFHNLLALLRNHRMMILSPIQEF